MDIGIFGGSFNPPHIAHLIVAELVRDQFGLEEIWWMPSAQPPHKRPHSLAAPRHRLAMTRLATADQPAFEVSEVEIERGGTSYTVDTVRALQEAHPGTDFGLVLGSDSLVHFGAWHRPDEIVRRVPLIVYRRPGTSPLEAPPRFADRVRLADAPLLEVSGTALRARRRQGRSVRYLVPPAVLEYMNRHGLYVESGEGG